MRGFLIATVLALVAGTAYAQTMNDPATDPTVGEQNNAGDDVFGDPADNGPTAGDVPGDDDAQGIEDSGENNGIGAGTVLLALLVAALVGGLIWYAMRRRHDDVVVDRERRL